MLTQLITLFEQYAGEPLACSEELTQAGSNRRYYRLYSATHQVVGCHSGNVDENQAFFYLSAHFVQKGLPFPKVLAVAADQQHYLQDDLGNTSLFELIATGSQTGSFSATQEQALHQTMALLPRIQFEGIEGLDTTRCYPQAEFDMQGVRLDLNYFKYYFLKPSLPDINEPALEHDFDTLVREIGRDANTCFMYRDFQSRNVMWHHDAPHCIDFQGGRKGMPHYDVASFLYQARANFGAELRSSLLDTYLQAAEPYGKVDPAGMRSRLPIYALLRCMQVLGAYGFRGYFERKAHFLKSVPYAMANVEQLLHDPHLHSLPTPYLKSLLAQLVALSPRATEPDNDPRLVVRVLSFSYLKGLPTDPSGNGGGFFFDCRSIVNPGRLEAYKALTGLDQPVIDFINSNEQMSVFLEHAYGLVKPAVERYAARGFRNLMVGFGCTGGQHRSVYAAQHVAQHLAQHYPHVRVLLQHREQGIQWDSDSK